MLLNASCFLMRQAFIFILHLKLCKCDIQVKNKQTVNMYLNFIYVFVTHLNSEKSSLRFSEALNSVMEFATTEQTGLLRSNPFGRNNFKKVLQQLEMEIELYLS